MLAKKLLGNDKLQLGDKQLSLPNVIIIVLNANKTIIFPGIFLSSAYERGVDAHRKF